MTTLSERLTYVRNEYTNLLSRLDSILVRPVQFLMVSKSERDIGSHWLKPYVTLTFCD